MNITALIVDDEPHARRYIRDLLAADVDIEIVGECKNGREAMSFIKNKAPDIVFMDIQMPGVTGMEVAEKIKFSKSMVIFTTAYDQYALKAFEAEAMDYLLKPFDENRFNEVLQRAKNNIEREQQAEFSEKLLVLYNDFRGAQSPHVTEFIVKEKGLEKAVKVTDIEYIEASSVYAILQTFSKSILYRAALNVLEQQLPPNFLRIHRAFIINLDCVISHQYLNNNTFEFELKKGKKIVSSRSYKEAVTNYLENS